MLLQALAETRLICSPFLNALGGANLTDGIFHNACVSNAVYCKYYHYKNTSLITSDILIQQISTLAKWLVTGHQPLKNRPSWRWYYSHAIYAASITKNTLHRP